MTLILFKILTSLTVSFYALSFQNSDGVTINMSSFQGKKVLIANIATTTPEASQVAELQQLQQNYGDSVVVIVFPSNSFGHESRTNTQIKEFCQSAFNSTFIIAEKSNVTGTGIHPVFAWLASIALNVEMNATTGADFQKFLISSNGMLMASFSSKVRPTDNRIIQAIINPF